MSLLRTGHRPEDWLDQGPSEPLAPKRISGSLVIGSPGPMELQRRNQRKHKATPEQRAKNYQAVKRWRAEQRAKKQERAA